MPLRGRNQVCFQLRDQQLLISCAAALPDFVHGWFQFRCITSRSSDKLASLKDFIRTAPFVVLRSHVPEFEQMRVSMPQLSCDGQALSVEVSRVKQQCPARSQKIQQPHAATEGWPEVQISGEWNCAARSQSCEKPFRFLRYKPGLRD